jgi:hypothetical protein
MDDCVIDRTEESKSAIRTKLGIIGTGRIGRVIHEHHDQSPQVESKGGDRYVLDQPGRAAQAAFKPLQRYKS